MEDTYDDKRLNCLKDTTAAFKQLQDKYGDVLLFFSSLLLLEAVKERLLIDLPEDMIFKLEEKAKLDYVLMMKVTGPPGGVA